MNVTFHIHIEKDITIKVDGNSQEITQILNLLNIHTTKLNQIMATQAEAAAQLQAVATQLGKVKEEVQKLVDAAGQEPAISPELQSAIDAVSAAVQGVDDLNPDAVPAPEPIP